MDFKDIKLSLDSFEVFDEPIKYESNDVKMNNYYKKSIVKEEPNVFPAVNTRSSFNGFNFLNDDLLKKINSGALKLKVTCEDDTDSEIEIGSQVQKFEEFKCKTQFTSTKKLTSNRVSRRNCYKSYKLQSSDVMGFGKNVLNISNSVSHINSNRLHCKVCNASFNYRGDVKRHFDAVHLQLKPFTCSYCKFSSTRKHGLKKHMIAYHIKTRIFGCHYCPYRAGSKYRLLAHESTVHKDCNKQKTKYYCAYCRNWMTGHKSSLKRHIITNHYSLYTFHFEEPRGQYERTFRPTKLHKYMCPHCNFSSKAKYKTEDHIHAKHSFIKPYKCNICSFSSSYRHTLKHHKINRHTQKYKCRFCNSKFNSKPALTNHEVQIHSALGDVYICSYCYESFKSKFNLCVHIKICHKNKFKRL